MQLPDISGFEYMIDYLAELGYKNNSTNSGFSYSEIESWCNLTSTTLNYWESNMLKVMSEEFALQISKTDINEPCPYIVEI